MYFENHYKSQRPPKDFSETSELSNMDKLILLLFIVRSSAENLEIAYNADNQGLHTVLDLDLHTVYLILLHTPSFLLEIRVIIKFSKNPCYLINSD